jgi:hypothetical protein
MTDKAGEVFAAVGFLLVVLMNGYVVAASFLGWADWDIGPFRHVAYRVELIVILAAFVGIGLTRMKNGDPPFFDKP